MKEKLPLMCGIAAAIVFFCQFSFGQANINEGLETASLWVDATTGNDSNSGTQSSPLKTIGKAASMAETNNQNGIGTLVTINPGTYRESVSMTHSPKDTSLPMTFEAATDGTVIWSGSTVYTGWTEYSDNKSIYTTGWTNQWGECPQLDSCPYQQDIMMRQELLAVNGVVMTEVMSLGEVLYPGTFYVDETSEKIYVWPPSGTDMTTATVEAATTPTLLTIDNKAQIVIRGLTFQYANTCRAAAAVVVTGAANNILFDTDTFQWNNGQGISINNPTTYFTVENSTAIHNGDSGFQESESQYGLWQNDTSSYNNWRGAQGAYYACNTAGFHAWEAHNDTLDGLTISFNEAYGVHWDTDNESITGSGINATGNLLTGLFVEKDPGPVAISSSYSCNQNSSLAVGGLVLRNSEGVSFTDGVLMNNSVQIDMIGVKGGIEVTDWITGKTTNLVTQNFTNTSNTIQGNNSDQLVFDDSYLDDSDWTTFQTTFSSSKNTWWNADNSTTPYDVPSPKSGTKDDFSAWQGVTGQDSNSSFKEPSGNPGAACDLTPAGPDFWITISSPLQTVADKGSTTYTLTLTPLNFTGKVTLTLDGISEVEGLSATLSSSSITTSGTSTLTVTAGKDTPQGTYSIVVTANNGNITHTVTTQLTVD
jgi:hypothetical protein